MSKKNPAPGPLEDLLDRLISKKKSLKVQTIVRMTARLPSAPISSSVPTVPKWEIFDKERYHKNGLHVAYFFAWLAESNLLSIKAQRTGKKVLSKFRARKILPSKLSSWFDGVLSSELIAKKALPFVRNYYLRPKEGYYSDFRRAMNFKESAPKSLTETWSSYDRVAEAITKRSKTIGRFS